LAVRWSQPTYGASATGGVFGEGDEDALGHVLASVSADHATRRNGRRRHGDGPVRRRRFRAVLGIGAEQLLSV